MFLTGTYDLDDDSLEKIYKMATRNRVIKINEPDCLERVCLVKSLLLII